MRTNFLRHFFNIRNQLVLGTTITGLHLSKNECYQKTEFYFQTGTSVIPHPQKVHKGGEDANFTTKSIVVVADGVGGWAAYGIDPGLYSKELCQRIKEEFEGNEYIYIPNPKQLIINAYKNTKAQGSTTVCVLTLKDQQINASFIGDSGYAIYRPTNEEFSLLFKSKEQQKDFNFPYQIGSRGDDPNCAVQDKHNIKENDLIVAGTDGLFDNVSAQQINSLLNESYKTDQVETQDFAEKLAKHAYKLSLDKKYDSPFAQQARTYGYRMIGGKSDDITVVVAQIRKMED